MENSSYYTFKHFLLEKWGKPGEGDTEEKRREKAFQRFSHAVRNKHIASKQTMRKWFSLNGCSLPSREHILRLGLELGMSVKETEEYLTYGISEPQLQVNDYMEFAAMYCLEHKLGYLEYESIIEFYELETENDTEIRQTNHTERMLNLYQEVKDYEKKAFMIWMCQNSELFKGYSKTTYDCFCSLVEECLLSFREQNKNALENTLLKTDFSEWAAAQEIPEEDRLQAIPRYVKNRKRGKRHTLSKELQREIREDYLFAYSSQDRLCDLLIVLWEERIPKKIDMQEIRLTNRKYISELLSISLQKKRQMEMKRELIRLKKREEAGEVVSEERKMLRRALTMQTQRVRMITRSDLLLLTQYVAGERYNEEINEQAKEFDREEAKEYFIYFANTILSSCKMRLLDERYRLDNELLSCFREDEMILLSKLLQGDF